jgi:hypothetical protein
MKLGKRRKKMNSSDKVIDMAVIFSQAMIRRQNEQYIFDERDAEDMAEWSVMLAKKIIEKASEK